MDLFGAEDGRVVGERAREGTRGAQKGWRLRQNKWGWMHQPMRRAEAVGQASGTINQFRIVQDITLVSASIRESVGPCLKIFCSKVVESGASVERDAPSRSRSRGRIKKRRASRACLCAAPPRRQQHQQVSIAVNLDTIPTRPHRKHD